MRLVFALTRLPGYRWLVKARVWTALGLLAVVSLRADLVVMQNGDSYKGKVLSLNANNLVLQSDVLGTISVPRARIANVSFGTNVVAKPPTTSMSAGSNVAAEVSPALRQLAAHTNLIQTVQSQFLAAAGPEANEKFSQMLNDLTTGKMSIADLRTQAKDVADQLRAVQRESGEDGSFTTDLYLSILDHFVQDAAPAKSATTNPPAGSPKR